MTSTNELENEIKLKAVFDSILSGILVINQHGIIETANRSAIELFGFEEKELLGKKIRELIVEGSLKAFDTYLFNYPDHDDIRREGLEIQILKKDGAIMPVAFSITPPMSEYNHLFVGMFQDISLRKNLEKEVIKQKENMVAIEEKLEKEQELSELKSRFVSMASHEFRTPLAGILSSLNLVERYLDTEKQYWERFLHREKIENHFIKIKESVNNLTSILNEFLSLAKLEEGAIHCKLEKINLDDLLKGTLQELDNISKPGQLINYSFRCKQKEFLLDNNMMRNTINNLVTNAIKYSGENKKIDVIVNQHKEEIEIIVSDDGIGIPESEQAKLFGRFFRAKNAVNIQGTGLGLNITKRYIKLMDGRINFTSKENNGSTFSIYLPIKQV